MDPQRFLVLKDVKTVLLILATLAVGIIVYSPHFSYPYPFHGDEWHHITEGVLVGEGIVRFGLETGFHFFLSFLFNFIDPVLSYKYLPAIWAILGSFGVFFLTKRKTSNNFYIALLSVIFFASIKSNVNILGLWFFVPLTFSIPFIYLYMYLFTEGIERRDKLLLWSSFAVMVFLLPIHAISVLFSIPVLFIYLLFNLKALKEKLIWFLPFLTIAPLGLIVFKLLEEISWSEVFPSLFKLILFERGWAVTEASNSFTDIYSFIGYIFAIIGFGVVVLSLRYNKKMLIFAVWPVTLLAFLIFYKIFGISPLSPYQRNWYYFAISLPPLSAIGLYSSIGYIIESLKAEGDIKNKLIIPIIVTFLIPTTFLIFRSYNVLPIGLELYQAIDNDDYEAIKFMGTLPNGNVIADHFVSMAIFPISTYKIPITTGYFHESQFLKDVDTFFTAKDCRTKEAIIKKHKVRFVLSKNNIQCGWELLYDKNNYLYILDESK